MTHPNAFAKYLVSGFVSVALVTPSLAQPAKPAVPATPATPAPAVTAPAVGGGPVPLAIPPGASMYSLDSFGPVNTSDNAAATYKRATEALMAAGGGVLIIPGNVPVIWRFANNSQGVYRKPAAPAPAKSWGATTGITIVDTRGGTVKVHPPQVTGLEINRTFNLPDGQSAPHWSMHPMLTLNNNIVKGSTSYRDFLQEDVAAGPDRRFYVATIRGLFPGMFLNAYGRKGVQRLWVKSLGYDKDKKMHYIVADTEDDHKKGAILDNKTHVNVARMETNANTELQSFDFFNERYHYSQGDTYLFDARFGYMGNIHSAGGDENGVCYTAYVQALTNIFKGTVAATKPGTDEVTFKNETNGPTLGTGRPLINLNPKKWITGTAIIVAPGSYIATHDIDPTVKDPVFEGKTYPTVIAPNPRTGSKELSMGGLIRLSADSPVTADAVGRYFAIDDPSEMVKDTIKRWYQISAITVNPDKTKTIKIVRYWWGAKEASSPTLYRDDNYTCDGHVKPLKFVIAPGANVYDVSRAVSYGQPTDKTLLVVPYADRGTPFDFEANDPIEQAIGSDPFHPVPMRAWTFDQVPSSFPDPVFDIANYGVRRATVLAVSGKGSDNKPAFDNVIDVRGRVQNVIATGPGGDIRGSVLRIAQGNHDVPITWIYGDGTQEANLKVDHTTGALKFDGTGIQANGILCAGGISGTEVESHNLRGISVPVPAGSKSFTVTFPTAEADAAYAVFLETTWMSPRAITERKPEGFTVTFAQPAPDNATLDWTLVR